MIEKIRRVDFKDETRNRVQEEVMSKSNNGLSNILSTNNQPLVQQPTDNLQDLHQSTIEDCGDWFLKNIKRLSTDEALRKEVGMRLASPARKAN
jgi:hypothetical protein